jgi:hypothetical protein
VYPCTLCVCALRKLIDRQVRSYCHDGLLLMSLRPGNVSQIECEAKRRCLADTLTAAKYPPE